MKKVLFLGGRCGDALHRVGFRRRREPSTSARSASSQRAVTVQAGDVVTFTNKDTANHQVVCAKMPVHVGCPQAGRGRLVHVSQAGKFTSVDPLNKNEKVTITVKQAPAAVREHVGESHDSAVWTLRGRAGQLSPAQVGQKLEILAQPVRYQQRARSVRRRHDDRRRIHVPGPAGGRTSYQARYKSTGGVVTSSPSTWPFGRP
jgi:plastocyanin